MGLLDLNDSQIGHFHITRVITITLCGMVVLLDSDDNQVSRFLVSLNGRLARIVLLFDSIVYVKALPWVWFYEVTLTVWIVYNRLIFVSIVITTVKLNYLINLSDIWICVVFVYTLVCKVELFLLVRDKLYII